MNFRVVALSAAIAAAALPAFTQTLPTGFYVENVISSGSFNVPVVVDFASDGRMFVGEKAGVVYVVQNGIKLSTPFLDVQSDVLNHHDRGLLGMALDPNFDTNGHIYLLYTFDWNGAGDFQRKDVAGRLVRYTVSSGNPNVANPASRLVLLGPNFTTGIPACYFSHAPGDIHFGSDGSLLVAAGDGASYSEMDPGGLYAECFGVGKLNLAEDIGAFRSQWTSSYAGKILRVDPTNGNGYPSNPFYTGNATDVASKVWCYGLRNPYRFGVRPNGSADPAQGKPGTLYIGDVGWTTWEELNVAKGGENFGWPCYEGPNPHSGYQGASPAHHGCSTIGVGDNPSLHTPGMAYWHHTNTGSSYPAGIEGSTAIGGDFYVGTKYPPEYIGRAFYADYSDQWMRTVQVDVLDNMVSTFGFGTDMGGIVELRYDPVSQYMHYIDIFTGRIMRIRHVDGDANGAPIAVADVTPQWGHSPLVVNCTASGSYDPNGDPLTFEWDFGDGSTSSAPDTSYTYTTDNNYTLTLTVRDDFGVATLRQWTIFVGNTPPTITVFTPENGSAYDADEMIGLGALASDAEDPEEALAYDWEITQVHGDHDHPNFYSTTGRGGVFNAVEHGLPHEVNFLRAIVTVTDTEGLAASTSLYLVLNRNNESDVTDQGTPIALITAPTGTGNPDISVIHDGVFPLEGTSDPLTQYDTYDGGGPRPVDWIGYQFPSTHYFSRLRFQEGIHFVDGGWWDSAWVEVRTDGVWQPVEFATFLPPNRGSDGQNFDIYTITFTARAGDAIRLVGVPGGNAAYISVGELRVDAIPRAEFTADVTVGSSPLAVTFTDLSNVTNPTTWLWNFGDGASSTQSSPTHSYSTPGPHTVNLTVTGDEGTLFEEKLDYIFVGTPGLLGEYYDTPSLSGNTVERVDAVVDFSWGTGSPDVAIPSDNFSARWSGWVQPRFTETIFFHCTTDDGVRLWVNNTLIVDQWATQGTPSEFTGAVMLTADRLYDIRMEYFEETGTAEAHLEWSSLSQTREIVPQSRLYARECGAGTGDVDGTGSLSPGDALCAFNVYLNSQMVSAGCNVAGFDCEVAAADADCDGTVTPSDALAIYNRYLSGLPLVSCFASIGGTPPLAPRYETHVTARTIVGGAAAGDDIIEITFSIDDPRSLDAFGLRVNYPSESMRFLGFERSSYTEGWIGLDARAEANASVRVGGFNRNALTRSGETALFKVRFSAPGGVDPDGVVFVDLIDDIENATVEDGGGSGGGPGEVPAQAVLHQNFPNPFNPETSIRYDVLDSGTQTRLAIYAVNGALVTTLVDAIQPAGFYEARWSGMDDRGQPAPSGVYFYVLESGSTRQSRRMVLLK